MLNKINKKELISKVKELEAKLNGLSKDHKEFVLPAPHFELKTKTGGYKAWIIGDRMLIGAPIFKGNSKGKGKEYARVDASAFINFSKGDPKRFSLSFDWAKKGNKKDKGGAADQPTM